MGTSDERDMRTTAFCVTRIGGRAFQEAVGKCVWKWEVKFDRISHPRQGEQKWPWAIICGYRA
jgi:hypothetical protein